MSEVSTETHQIWEDEMDASAFVEENAPRYIVSIQASEEGRILVRCVFPDFPLERGFVAVHLAGAFAQYAPGDMAVVGNRIEMYLYIGADDIDEDADGYVSLDLDQLEWIDSECQQMQTALEAIFEKDADPYQMIQLLARNTRGTA